MTTVEVSVDPDDGADHHSNSIQVSTDSKLTLKWEASNAKSVHIDGLGDFDATGEQEIPTLDASYSLVAKAEDGTESAPWPMEIHTHDPDDVVSQHVDLGSGVASIVSFNATKDGAPVTEARAGDNLELVLVASDGSEGAQLDGQDADLSDTADGFKRATATVSIGDDATGSFEARVLKDGSVADTSTIQISIQSAKDQPREGNIAVRVLLLDDDHNPMPGAQWKADGATPDSGTAGNDGIAAFELAAGTEKITLCWGHDDPAVHQITFWVLFPDDREGAARRRLDNLGFASGVLEDDLKAFQANWGREQTGSLDDVEQDLTRLHDEGVQPEAQS